MIKRIIFILLGAVVVAVVILLLIGFRPFILTSTSMEPTCPKGSLIIVDTRVKNPDIGDIVAYREKDIFVLHRLIGPNLLQGDASPTAQHILLTEENVIGREVICIPGIGNVLGYLVDHKWILFVLAALLILIAIRPRKLFRHKGKKNHDTSQVGKNE